MKKVDCVYTLACLVLLNSTPTPCANVIVPHGAITNLTITTPKTSRTAYPFFTDKRWLLTIAARSVVETIGDIIDIRYLQNPPNDYLLLKPIIGAKSNLPIAEIGKTVARLGCEEALDLYGMRAQLSRPLNRTSQWLKWCLETVTPVAASWITLKICKIKDPRTMGYTFSTGIGYLMGRILTDCTLINYGKESRKQAAAEMVGHLCTPYAAYVGTPCGEATTKLWGQAQRKIMASLFCQKATSPV